MHEQVMSGGASSRKLLSRIPAGCVQLKDFVVGDMCMVNWDDPSEPDHLKGLWSGKIKEIINSKMEVKMYFAEDRKTKLVGWDQLLVYSDEKYDTDKDARAEAVCTLLYLQTHTSSHDPAQAT